MSDARRAALDLQQDVDAGVPAHTIIKQLATHTHNLLPICNALVDDRSLIQAVAASDQAELLDYILNTGVSIHQLDDTLLCTAITHKSGNIVSLALRAGASLATCREDGKTPVHVAAESGHAAILAASNSHPAAVSRLLRAGADLHAPAVHAPLQAAALLGDHAMVGHLLESGAKVNSQDAQGSTALHLASYKRHARVIRTLLQAGAAPDIKDRLGLVPHQLAPDHATKQLLLLQPQQAQHDA